jgi:stage III sporulation protein AB
MGMFYSHRQYRRVEWLRQAERLLDALLGRLTYTAQPLAVLWETFAANDVFSRYSLVQDTVDGLRRDQVFSLAFADAIDRAARQGMVQASEKQLLLELGDALGRTGLSEQKSAIHGYRERLSECRIAAEQTACMRGRIYQMMGVAGGVGLALLLL